MISYNAQIPPFKIIIQKSLNIKTQIMSLDKQPRFLRITIVVVNYLIFAGKVLYKLPTILAIELQPKTLHPANHGASNCIRGPTTD